MGASSTGSLSLAVVAMFVTITLASAAISDESHLLLPTQTEVGKDLPVATPWPWEFTISFTTSSDRGTQEGFVAYDWANKQQLLLHSAGSYACLEYGTELDCSVLFNPTGIFVIIPSESKCWLETPGVGSVPPDWVVQGEFVGLQEFEGVGVCVGFAFPPTAHVYWERVEDGRPCAFTFSVVEKNYTFKPDTLVLGCPDAEYFALPDYCTLTKPDDV